VFEQVLMKLGAAKHGVQATVGAAAAAVMGSHQARLPATLDHRVMLNKIGWRRHAPQLSCNAGLI
jgi:hypothetical protein